MLDLRTERPECLDIGTRHISKQTKSWKWNGEDRWWNVFTTIKGYNGAGGYWVEDEWCWNGNPQVVRSDIRTLSAEQSRELDSDIARLRIEHK